jgi:predicted nucleic acid-binding protein
VKRYVHEADSPRVRRLMRAGRVVTSRISEVEIASALERRRREGVLPDAASRRAFAALEHDVSAWIIVEVTPSVAGEARDLLQRHGLRSGDAIQLASCLHLQRRLRAPLSFLAFDHRLNVAAREERLSLA